MKKNKKNKKKFTNNVPRGTNKNQSYENKIHYRIRRKKIKKVEIYVVEGHLQKLIKLQNYSWKKIIILNQ